MTETQSLLDQIANAKRERDAEAVCLADLFVLHRGPARPANAVNWDYYAWLYESARSRLAALEAQLTDQGKDAK